jgi:hypothetical protein
MIPLTIVSFMFGVLLGLRFRALAVVPATALILISVAAAALAQGADLWRPLGAITLTFIALQAGFLAGALARPLLAAWAAHRAGTADGRTDSGSAKTLDRTVAAARSDFGGAAYRFGAGDNFRRWKRALHLDTVAPVAPASRTQGRPRRAMHTPEFLLTPALV